MSMEPPVSTWRHARAASGSPDRAQSGRGRWRVALTMGCFALLYAAVATRLVLLGAAGAAADGGANYAQSASMSRPDILDRNGETLATDIKTAALYAEPRRVVDPEEAAEMLVTVFPDLDRDRLRRQLATNSAFLYLKREISPRQQQAVHRLGIPGIGFRVENKRFYPGGATAGHILGSVNVDNQGIAGIERHLDENFLGDLHQAGFAVERGLEPVRLSVDLRVQHALRYELAAAMSRYRAIAAVGIVLDVRTGEVVGMSSLPDYDPNDRQQALDKDRLNRATVGVFEMGSTFKAFTAAMSLDSGLVSINESFDATQALQVGSQRISDFHGKRRWLTVPEVFIFSSNIATGRMALKVGTAVQHDFFEKIGFLRELKTELPETAKPIVPRLPWSKISSVTMAFGHGISVSPMQTAAAGAALINGGNYIPPTFLPRSEAEAEKLAVRVIKPETSEQLRQLFRLNVLKGSGKRAAVEGYRVGGKTGTAEKVVNGRYSSDMRRNAFLAAFPMDAPRYLVLVVLDEPEPEKPGMGATAGVNAAPTVAAVVRRIAPMLGVEPLTIDPAEEPAMALAAAL